MERLSFAESSADCAVVGSSSINTSPCFTCWPSVTSTLVIREEPVPVVVKLGLVLDLAATVPLVLTVFVTLPTLTAAVCVAAVATEPPRRNSHHTPVTIAAVSAPSSASQISRDRQEPLPSFSKSS